MRITGASMGSRQVNCDHWWIFSVDQKKIKSRTWNETSEPLPVSTPVPRREGNAAAKRGGVRPRREQVTQVF